MAIGEFGAKEEGARGETGAVRIEGLNDTDSMKNLGKIAPFWMVLHGGHGRWAWWQ